MAPDKQLLSGDQLYGDALKAFVLDKLLISHEELQGRRYRPSFSLWFSYLRRSEGLILISIYFVELDPSAADIESLQVCRAAGDTRKRFSGRNVDLMHLANAYARCMRATVHRSRCHQCHLGTIRKTTGMESVNHPDSQGFHRSATTTGFNN